MSAHEQFTLVTRGQRVYVVTDWLITGKPECLRDYWRVNTTPDMLPHGWQEGEVTRGRFPGLYTLRCPRAGWSAFTDLHLVDGGQSHLEFREEITLPRPKVRAGVEVEWDRYGSTWRKYLKTRGWVNINSLPDRPAREGNPIDTTGFSICPECSRIRGKHHDECSRRFIAA